MMYLDAGALTTLHTTHIKRICLLWFGLEYHLLLRTLGRWAQIDMKLLTGFCWLLQYMYVLQWNPSLPSLSGLGEVIKAVY